MRNRDRIGSAGRACARAMHHPRGKAQKLAAAGHMSGGLPTNAMRAPRDFDRRGRFDPVPAPGKEGDVRLGPWLSGPPPTTSDRCGRGRTVAWPSSGSGTPKVLLALCSDSRVFRGEGGTPGAGPSREMRRSPIAEDSQPHDTRSGDASIYRRQVRSTPGALCGARKHGRHGLNLRGRPRRGRLLGPRRAPCAPHPARPRLATLPTARIPPRRKPGLGSHGACRRPRPCCAPRLG